MKIPSLPTLGLISAIAVLAAIAPAPIAFRLKDEPRISADQAKRFLRGLRQSMTPGGEDGLPRGLEAIAQQRCTLVLTAWSGGLRQGVFQIDGKDVEHAFRASVAALRGAKRLSDTGRLRLEIDFVTMIGWIPESGALASLAFVEGTDGISGVVSGRRIFLPPEELIRNNRYGGFAPLPEIDATFKMGIDIERTRRTILHQAAQIGVRGDQVTELRRFRTLSVVEGRDFAPRRFSKGTVERPPISRPRALASVLAGARYLSRALQESGVYRYYYDPLADHDEHDRYNWPRHAGVTYSLAQVGRLLRRPEFVETARRALERFERQLVQGPDGSLCLESDRKCYLGSSALGLLAIAEYRIASGDPRFDETAARVAKFLKSMQRPDRFFYQDWYPDKGVDRSVMKLYASQQAVFALARHAMASGDREALEAAVAGMDFLAGPYWNHFLGSFFFGPEHWTCLAAEEIYAVRPKRAYAELCQGIGVHYDNITHDSTATTPYAEDVGGMAVTQIFMPRVGGTATAAEALVSAVRLGDAAGLETDALKRQIRTTFDYLVRGQVTIHDGFWIRRPEIAVGGFYEAHATPKIRIDNVQHAISAMVRGLDLLPDGPPKDIDAAQTDLALPEERSSLKP